MLKGLFFVVAAGIFGWAVFFNDPKPHGPDLMQVLDRAEFAINAYQERVQKPTEDMADAQMDVFLSIYNEILNNPKFYSQPLGVELKQDATFLGFLDKNTNQKKDEGEQELFTVEVDMQGRRLIGTDLGSRQSVGHPFPGAGFATGWLIGSLLNRQRAAGIQPNAFSNRNVGSASAYRNSTSSARSASRSGGIRSGK